MLKYALLALVGYVSAQAIPMNATATPMNATTTPKNVTFNPMYNCESYKTCDQTIQNATGNSSKGAMCYYFKSTGTPYGFWTSTKYAGIANGISQLNLPKNNEGSFKAYKCLSQSQLESGNNGDFTYVAPKEKCQSYQNYNRNTGRYEMKRDCYTDLGYFQVPNVSSNTVNLTYEVGQVSYSQVQTQNGQEVSDFYMTTTAGPAGGSRYAAINTVRQKIMDYFFYAIVQGEDLSTDYGNCSATCGQGLFKQQCCGEISILKDNIGTWDEVTRTFKKSPDQKDVFYVCINQSLAAADMTMNIMDASVNVQCAQSTMSGAVRLVTASAVALLALMSI